VRVLLLVPALLLGGCLTNGGSWAEAAKQIATDPNCGHVDRVNITLSALGSQGSVFLERNCPMPGANDPALQQILTRLDELGARIEALE